LHDATTRTLLKYVYQFLIKFCAPKLTSEATSMQEALDNYTLKIVLQIKNTFYNNNNQDAAGQITVACSL
jgi:hypothetical protein